MRLKTLAVALAVLAVLSAATEASATTQVGSLVVGSAGYYDYSPTVIQDGQVQDFWWCGDYSGRTNDTIFHEQFSFVGGVHITIPQHPSLIEGAPGTWDSVYTCNPDVVEGSFVNPLGDGVTWKYAMYYV